MPLSRNDCAQLLRVIEELLQENDPSSLDFVLRGRDYSDDPRRSLLEFLQTVRRYYTERSGGAYGSILDTVNHFVRLEDGSPVRAISVTLSPVEQTIFEAEEINLAEIPDRSEFLRELETVTDQIKREIDLPEGEG